LFAVAFSFGCATVVYNHKIDKRIDEINLKKNQKEMANEFFDFKDAKVDIEKLKVANREEIFNDNQEDFDYYNKDVTDVKNTKVDFKKLKANKRKKVNYTREELQQIIKDVKNDVEEKNGFDEDKSK